jgi:hypothetical protein
MKYKIYLYRVLRNMVLLNIIYLFFDFIIEYNVREGNAIIWMLSHYPMQFVPPTIIGLIMPFLIQYKTLRIVVPNVEKEFISKINEAILVLNYELKKEKFGIHIYRFTGFKSKFIHLYFDRLYLKIGKDIIEINGLSTTIIVLEEILKNMNISISSEKK